MKEAESAEQFRLLQQAIVLAGEAVERFCRKFSFEMICGMLFLYNQR